LLLIILPFHRFTVYFALAFYLIMKKQWVNFFTFIPFSSFVIIYFEFVQYWNLVFFFALFMTFYLFIRKRNAIPYFVLLTFLIHADKYQHQLLAFGLALYLLWKLKIDPFIKTASTLLFTNGFFYYMGKRNEMDTL